MKNKEESIIWHTCDSVFRKEPLSLPKMKYDLNFLRSGLVTCPIIIANLPFEETVKCNALIDTGSDVTIICKTIFDKFSTIDETKLKKSGIYAVSGDKDGFDNYTFHLKIPSQNWQSLKSLCLIADLSARKEYSAIIGVDLLKHFDFVYNGVQGVAYLNY